MRQRAIGALLAAVVTSLLVASSAAAQAPATNILVFHGTPNATVDAGVAAIQALGAANDFAVTRSQNPADFTAANLAQYRAIVFLGNAGNALSAAQETALQGYINNGGGFVGIGGAAEGEPGSTFYGNLIGARPTTTSPTGTVAKVVEVGDRVHPATKSLPLEWNRQDVWYEWQQRPTGQVHTVARYRAPDAPAGDGTAIGGTDWPISWCRDFQGGRSFYTGMGRTAASYDEANFRTHLLGAIRWSSGMIRAGCKATIAANYQGERLVEAGDGNAVGLATSGESHGVALAPNGWAIYIGRADCRTNEERGAVIGQPSSPRILDFANRNVGVGCGNVHIWDPEAANGTVNSGVTKAGVLPVYGDRGAGDEINGKIEAGLLGIAVSPDFAQTGHVYLQYFPTFNPDNPIHPGLTDGDQRRITKMAKPRISRFTIDLDTKRLELDSEVVIFEYESQIYSCCHRGGGMGFDSEGNLYVTTGDSNSSQRTNGYSGNFQPARCPRASELNPPQDPNVASNDHCGNNAISFSDARRTAGSTNDYNGKMLRLNPVETIPDGSKPTVGVNSTYTLPDGDSPNGPNLFSGTEDGGGKTKPEIYAMGLRNPSRLFIDPETDIPYSAWVGPDAGQPSATMGPSTYENATQLATAGNYGWPYCMGNQQAYRDRVADGSLRTTNAPGYVSGGPAGSPTQGWYDCKNLVNDSTNNTGLTELPHQTGTGKDAGTAHPTNLWYSRGNPLGANGCPNFPRELGANNAPNYGAPEPAQLCPYLTASGATVFNGPVYRYDDDAEDNSARWPEYWDGRWFVQDFGNNSAKHGLLLDPATDQDGGQPVYADSLRGVLNWQANYMDSKFGPDGAYYVQVYSGFFSTGPQAGLYRFAYTGGPDTPNPDPQWTTTGTPREIRFSLGSSGGVSYVWDFGDGSATSTERNPTHTYAAAGTYTARLTVRYADGEELSKTVAVNVSADAARPTTTAQTTGTNPVEVRLSATDGAGGTGVEWTEYRVDGGGWTRNTNSASAEPFVTTLTVRGQGAHTVEFRSRDRAGNVEDPPGSVSFTIAPPGGGGSSCLPQSDEFAGSALDAKWEVRREAGGGPVVASGSLGLPILQGDFIANDPLASNTLLQDAPSGEWTVTTRLNTSAIDANGEQAGLVIWKSENPNTFSKIVAIRSGGGTYQFEHIVTQNGGVNPGIPQSITPAPGGQMPAQVLLRARYDGTKVIGEFSGDDGATWTLIGNPGHAAPLQAPLKVGLAAFRGSNGGGTATYDWFRVHAGSEAGGPFECATTCVLKSDSFDGALNTTRWSFRHPTTPATGERAPRTENGNLVFPLGAGAVDRAETGPLAFLGQRLPEGDFTVEAKVNAPGLDTDDSRTDDPYAQVGLGLFQGNDDWIGIYQTRNGDTPDTDSGTYFEVKHEDEGTWTAGNRVGQADGSVNLPTYYLRATRTGDTLTAAFSRNGTQWTDLEVNLNLATIFAEADGPVYIGPLGANGQVTATYEYIRFTPDECPDQCNPLSDQFEGGELDPKWELVNPHATSKPTVDGGNLKLPLVPGDLFGGNGTAQMILQQAPADSWVATAKIAHAAVDTNGEAAGLALINSFNPNHFVKTALQFKNDTDPNTTGNQPGKWAERVVTSGGNAVVIPPATVPWPNSGALNLTGDSVWVRFVHDAATRQVTTWTSTNGTTFSSFGAPISVEQYLNRPGGFRIGLFGKHDGTGDDMVNVDAFNVVAGTADPQTPGNDCGGSACVRSDEFDGTSLDTERWSFRHPTTPDSGARAPRVEGGRLVFPIGQNSVDNDRVGPIAFLGQPLPEGDFTVEAKINAPGLNEDDTGLISKFAQVGLGLYKSDGDWIGAYQTRNADVGTAETYFEVKYETNNTRQLGPRVDSGPATEHLPTYYMRVSRAGNTVTAAYSLNGTTWTDLGVSLNITEVLPGAGPIYIGALGVNGSIEATYDYIRFTPDAGCPPAGDTTPPRTTHTLAPASPDGEGGWYKSPVQVTLNATDNDGGSGVDKTEYRFAGTETWTAYTGPITVDDEGRHTIEYRSVDEEGNTESAKSVTFRIDPTAPTTTARLNGEAPQPSYDGPVEVDLNADDGAGSGVRATQIRVDGGEWKPYVEEETILNSATDLQKWEQAGPGGLNWMTEEGGFARTTGGLGMPWYPVKPYGNFSLKLQWRDSSAGAAGNSGVFVRFPHPVETVARPADQRYPCQVGSATSQPAWVAIFCGHEIQINDAQTSEPQKTGSIYNFSPLNETQARVQPKGTWVDYEVRVVGQTYTIVRNGVVLQTFENTPDKPSSRAGDPSTSDRQFTSGYIGLQNHGGGDVIDFRNIRVLPLDEGAVTGPVTVEGAGEHTVEYRSTDVAGNQEAVKSTTFTIGAADGTPPVTTHELDPAQPGEGGTYNGPVGVTLSATDPEEPGGGGTPETHDVNALPSSWSPNTLEVATGDVVRWNFPAETAAAPHDVWVIEPGEAPNSDGRQVTSGFKFPGDPPVSETLDEVGTWTWVCKIHSHREATGWEGMVGTAEVTAAGGIPGSGVDFTEYRVNTDGATGNWVRSENTGGADPFETSFEVSAAGDHVVEYRSTDNAGNQEAIKSVDFSIAEADPDAPTVEGFANPSSGTAPLLVQFSSSGWDPQGGELTYEWEFGDGGGSFNQDAQHTYTEPGTYTATVTVTDPQGKTGSDTVEIVVTEEGNQAPTVRATADRRRGDAPLPVVFSAQATDPDGPAGEITYLWDFGDRGATAFGRNATYTYPEPGTYTATVTATDRHGAFDTAEVEVVVDDPPGNNPPEVQVAAAPEFGTAPLEVRFTTSVTDPDGDTVTTPVWNFGDGGNGAAGASVTRTFSQPGTYTVTARVRDQHGVEDTDSVTITVNPPGSSPTQQGSPPQGSQTPQSQGDVGGEQATRPSITAPRSKDVRQVLRRGLRLKVTCIDACRAKSVLRFSGQRVGASKALRIKAGGTRTVVVRLDRVVRRNLLAAMRQAGVKRITATAITTIVTGDVTRAFPVKITLRR